MINSFRWNDLNEFDSIQTSMVATLMLEPSPLGCVVEIIPVLAFDLFSRCLCSFQLYDCMMVMISVFFIFRFEYLGMSFVLMLWFM